jgi:hypothetical protein
VLVINMWTEGCVLFIGCLNLTVEPNVTAGSFSSKESVKRHGIDVDFSALVRATVTFSLKTVNFKAAGPITPPDCYRFDVVVRNWISVCIQLHSLLIPDMYEDERGLCYNNCRALQDFQSVIQL